MVALFSSIYLGFLSKSKINTHTIILRIGIREYLGDVCLTGMIGMYFDFIKINLKKLLKFD